MYKDKSSSTARLLQLCGGYFVFYVITGVAVKWFLSPEPGYPGLHGMEYLVYNTAGGTLMATLVVLVLRWYRLDSVGKTKLLGVEMPVELPYIVASGLCTAIVVPTTTLLYSFEGISVMVAMVIMRGSVIIIGRVVDAIQIKKGILNKTVYTEENIAMVTALLAVSVKIVGGDGDGGKSPFNSVAVIIVFGSYITAYSFRIYIMNYYKNTRKQESDKDNNKAFFAIEQISSTLALILITLGVVACVTVCGASGPRVTPFANAVTSPDMEWAPWAYLAGIGYGVVAFFSVFLFMFKGRTATFAGLVNRLTSLIAGTTATLLFAFAFTGDYPEIIDWISLIFIFAAVGFMGKAEKKRRREMSEAEGHQKPKEETSF